MNKKIFIGIITFLISLMVLASCGSPTKAEEPETGGQTKEETPVYKTGLYKIGNDYKYYKNGQFEPVTGVIAASDKKQVYVEKGIFKNTVTGIVKRLSDSQSVYVENGVFRTATGIAKQLSDGKQLYVEKGVFKKATGIAKRLSDGKKLYVKKGVFKKATGIAKQISNGKLLYVKKGVFKKATGIAKIIGKNKYRYVKKGVYTKKFTGLAKRLTDKKWYFVSKGTPTNNVKKFVLSPKQEAAGLKRRYVEAYARAVAETITNKSMSESEKIRVCFDYVITHFASTNNPRIPHFTGKGWQYLYAYDMFGPRGGGNCMSFGAAFAFIAKAAGCKEVYAINNGAHGWTEINGLVYDPEQYHDTDNRKIYAKSYSDSMVTGYWASVSGANSKKVRKLIKPF